MAKKTPEQIAEFNRRRAANKAANLKRAAETKAKHAGIYGGSSTTKPTKPKPTAPQTHSQKAEVHRAKYTPSGLQSLVDVMGKKKKKPGGR